MQLAVRDAQGADLEPIEVDDAVFGIEPNEAVVHQTLVAQLAARRGGNASTKSRGEVRGSRAKLRRQKGLGMARVGSASAPIRRGGCADGRFAVFARPANGNAGGANPYGFLQDRVG